MTTALKRTGAALLTLLMFCVLTLGASAAANTPVGVKFWKEKSDKESMANSGIDSDREASLTRQSNGTYTLTLPVKQVTKLNVTGYLSGLTIGDVTYTGTLTGEIEKGNGILTIKNLPASVLTGSDVFVKGCGRSRRPAVCRTPGSAPAGSHADARSARSAYPLPACQGILCSAGRSPARV